MRRENRKPNSSFNQLRREWQQKWEEERRLAEMKESNWERLKRSAFTHINANLPAPVVEWLSFVTLETYLWSALWLLLWFIFVRLEFGLVYFISSLLIIIFTVGVGRRHHNELSAYNVFNKDLKTLPGQLKASQLENELLLKTPQGT